MERKVNRKITTDLMVLRLTLFCVVQEVRLLQSKLRRHYFKHMRVDNLYNIGIKGFAWFKQN